LSGRRYLQIPDYSGDYPGKTVELTFNGKQTVEIEIKTGSGVRKYTVPKKIDAGLADDLKDQHWHAYPNLVIVDLPGNLFKITLFARTPVSKKWVPQTITVSKDAGLVQTLIDKGLVVKTIPSPDAAK